jgi:FkbM family methyltransferase
MRLRRLIKRAMAAVGCDVRRYRPVVSDPFVAQSILLNGQPCRIIFDVGAHHGDVTALYLRLFPEAEVYAFEPFPPAFEMLAERFRNHPRVHPIGAAVSSRSGEATLHVNRHSATNSLLPTHESYAVSEAVTEKEITVPTITLDEFRTERNLPRPDILKFDIQGNELEALRGAVQTLRDNGPAIIYSEVLFMPLYQGGALFGELSAFLEDLRYSLFNLYSLHCTTRGRLEFGDALFVNDQLRRTVEAAGPKA